MNLPSSSDLRARPYGLARKLITAWALVGGCVLLAVVAVNAWSIIAAAVINTPFPGDFELTEMGAAIAVFCFLPYCQLTKSNVTADVFTVKASDGHVAMMSISAALIAILFSGLLLWRMYHGLQDYREYSEFTAILQIPLWWAFVPALLSLALLLVASLITLSDSFEDRRRAKVHKHG